MGKRNRSTGGRQRHQKQREEAHKKHVANKRVDKSSSDEEENTVPSEEMSTTSDLPNGTVLKPDGRVRVKKSVMKRLQRREMVRKTKNIEIRGKLTDAVDSHADVEMIGERHDRVGGLVRFVGTKAYGKASKTQNGAKQYPLAVSASATPAAKRKRSQKRKSKVISTSSATSAAADEASPTPPQGYLEGRSVSNKKLRKMLKMHRYAELERQHKQLVAAVNSHDDDRMIVD